MKRRNFIYLSTLTAAAVSVPFLNCSGPNPELDKQLAVPQVLSQLVDEPTIKAIGLSFSTLKTSENSVKKLRHLLTETSDGKTVSSATPVKDIYAALEMKIQNDFESGNTVILNGWILSLTEARQCALFSLISTKH
jgi:hypothetical protein